MIKCINPDGLTKHQERGVFKVGYNPCGDFHIVEPKLKNGNTWNHSWLKTVFKEKLRSIKSTVHEGAVGKTARLQCFSR